MKTDAVRLEKTLQYYFELQKTNTEKGITIIKDASTERFIPYNLLYKTSLQYLHFFQSNGIKKGSELVFQISDNEQFIYIFWACILGNIIPIPVTVGTNNENFLKTNKVWDILNDPYLITNKSFYNDFSTWLNKNNGNSSIDNKVLFVENVDLNGGFGTIVESNLNDIVLIQFSSGSTGDPKGVILKHKNIIANVDGLIKCAELSDADTYLSWMPLTHDLGMIVMHLVPVVAGINLVIMQPMLFVLKPLLWLKKASDHKATVLASPNFGYRHFLEAAEKKSLLGLDLSHVRMIYNGAEPISFKLCQSFLEFLQPYKLSKKSILPSYGLAEASVGVALAPVGDEIRTITVKRNELEVGKSIHEADVNDTDATTFVDEGYPIPHCDYRIVDGLGNLVEEKKVGLIEITGENVTAGYYNNPEATKAVFSSDGWLKTGDLGFSINGRLIITGRVKEIIFSNGLNYYPSDLERVLEENCPELGHTETVIVGVFNHDRECNELLAFIKIKGAEVEQFVNLISAVKNTLNKCTGLQIDHVIPVNKIPKTTSGKIQRYRLQSNYSNHMYDEIISRISSAMEQYVNNREIKHFKTPTEEKLVSIWKKLFKSDCISTNDNFFAVGGTSLYAMQMIDAVRNEFNYDLSFQVLFEKGTIEQIARELDTRQCNMSKLNLFQAHMDPEHIYEPFPLTEIQTAYLLGRNKEFELGGIGTLVYFEIETSCDINRLNESINKVILRHPMLRTIILPEGNQKIIEFVPSYTIEVYNYTDLNEESKKTFIEEMRNNKLQNVFDPGKYPLFEISAVKTGNQLHVLMVSFDMLIADAASLFIIGKDLSRYYADPTIKIDELAFSFRDYILNYNKFKHQNNYVSDKQYWMEMLPSFPSSPQLPLRTMPSLIVKPKFKRKTMVFSNSDYEILKTVSLEHQLTCSALLLTLYAKVLAYWSNQPQLAINLTVFNRFPFNSDIHQIVGDFTSVILTDFDLEKNPSFWDLVSETQKKIFNGLQHRQFDGVELIREITKKNSMGTHAVMPIVFTSLLFNDEMLLSSGWNNFGTMQYSVSQTPQVIIDCQVSDVNDTLQINWDYVEDLFEESIISSMFSNYRECIDALISKKRIIEISLPENESTIISTYNSTGAYIPKTTMHQLFEEQCKKTPELIAVELLEEKLTYNELDKRSNQCANFLHEQKIGSGDFVGVITARCTCTIVHLLAVLKVGAAYVPIEPEYPVDRKKFIIENSGCKIVLTPDTYVKNCQNYPETAVCNSAGPDDVAYVIYTSGSTGRPKGVVIKHGAVVNTIIDVNNRIGFTSNDKILGFSSMCFDLSVYDIFGSFSVGATLVMINDSKNIDEIITTIQNKQVSIWNSVPAAMDNIVAKVLSKASLPSLETVLLSGDWIPVDLPAKISICCPQAKIISLGGATEASIWSIYYPVLHVDKSWKSIPYGYPLSNQTFYVLNYEKNICPCEVVGELYIGGDGLAACYMNDKEKTAQSFINHRKLGRIYKTGDFGVLHRDGCIEFLGRRDQQVKLNGYRIELGEIEKNIRAYPGVSDAVVAIKEYQSEKRLVAYIVPRFTVSWESINSYLSNNRHFCRRSSPRLPLNIECNFRNGGKNIYKSVIEDISYDGMSIRNVTTEFKIGDTLHVNFPEINGSKTCMCNALISHINSNKIGLSKTEYSAEDYLRLKNGIDLIGKSAKQCIVDNRRKYFRIPLNVSCKLICGHGNEIDATSIDLSPFGVSCSVNIELFEVGNTINVSLDLPGDNICHSGRIAWKTNSRVGIALIKEEAYKLKKIVDTNSRHKTPTTMELRSFLLDNLPEYMIPSAFLYINEIPLSPNGKVDRKSLPEPKFAVKAVSESQIQKEPEIPPRTIEMQNQAAEISFKLKNILKNILKISDVASDADFFMLGGNSLQAYQLIIEIDTMFGVKIPFDNLYKNPSIIGLQQYISENADLSIGENLNPGKSNDFNYTSTGLVKKQTDKNKCFFWSPIIHWEKDSDKIKIGRHYFDDLNIFPKFYFIAQNGISIEEIYNEFHYIDKNRLDAFIDDLLINKILIASLIQPIDIFSSQRKLFKNPYPENIQFESDQYQEFKKKQLNRKLPIQFETTIELEKEHSFPGYIEQRKTWRSFKVESIPFITFSKLLSVLKQTTAGVTQRYYYASAGGIYPIDVYIYVKENRVQNVEKGLYYYDPLNHSLGCINKSCFVTDESHYFRNKSIFNASAFSVYIVYNAEVNMPIYGTNGYYFSFIDAGIMIGALTQASEHLNMGLCSIGEMNFDSIKKYFRLTENQIFLHGIEFGLKPVIN